MIGYGVHENLCRTVKVYDYKIRVSVQQQLTVSIEFSWSCGQWINECDYKETGVRSITDNFALKTKHLRNEKTYIFLQS